MKVTPTSDRWTTLLCAGVSGTRKTTAGQILADELSIPLIDADWFHTAEAIERMRSGTPLDDAYRADCVERVVGGMIVQRRIAHVNLIVACPCLKWKHRERFRKYPAESQIAGGQVVIIWPVVPREVLLERLKRRDAKGTHFFPASLLDSQLEAAEVPTDDEDNVIKMPYVPDETPGEFAKRIYTQVPMLHPFAER